MKNIIGVISGALLTGICATICGAQLGIPGQGANSVTVRMVDAVDSNAAGATGRSFRAAVAQATNAGGTAVPVGTGAIVMLVSNGGGFTLSLTSLTVKGQALAVTGESPSTGALAGRVNVPTTVGGYTVPSLPWGKKKPAAGNQVQTAVSGSRVYVPAGTSVTFRLAPSAQTTPGQATQTSTPTAPATPTTQSTQPAVGTSADARQSTPASASDVVWNNIKYQLQGCQRQAPHIVCSIQVTNLAAADAHLFGGGTNYVDQSGNVVKAEEQTLANCGLRSFGGGCLALSGIAMSAKFVFTDVDGQSSTLHRLQIGGQGGIVAQFNNVPVQ